MFDLYEELVAVIDALDGRGLAYALCGGIAMAVHGFTRATDDIDLLVRASDADPIENAVGALGYIVKATPMRFSDGAMQIRGISKIDQQDDDVMTLDLLLVTNALEEVWRSRLSLIWRDRPISVVSREGLIALKRFRSSKQDLADIEHLESGA